MRLPESGFIVKPIIMTVGFAVLAFSLGQLRFSIPVLGSMTSSLNEVGILISVFYLPHWFYVMIVGVVSVLGAPEEVLWLSMGSHALAAVVAWQVHRYLKNQFTDAMRSSGWWALFVFGYYNLIFLPILLIYAVITGSASPTVGVYTIQVFKSTSFEMVTTIVVTTLYHFAKNEFQNRLETETRLRQREAHYRTLVENTPDIIAGFDSDCRYLFINSAVSSVSPLPVEYFIGKTMRDVGFSDTQVEEREALIRHVFQTQQPVETEFEFTGKDATSIFDWRLYPVLDSNGNVLSVFSISRDITDRKRAERTMMESEARFRSLYTKTPVMMHSIDPDGRLISVSDYWLQKMGYTADEVIGRLSTDFLTPHSARYAIHEVFPAFKKTGVCHDIEYQFVKKNGQTLDVLLSAIAERNSNGEIVRSLAVLTDVTERKKLELNLIQAQKSESLGRVAGGIAHDMNNLLAVILPSAQLILSRPDDRDQVIKFAEVTLSSARRASDILKQLLVFSRQTPLNKTTSSINDLIGETNRLLIRLLGKNVQIILDLHSPLPFVDVDSTQFQQVLINLCVNARDAMNESGTITIGTRGVDLDEKQAARHGVPSGAYVELRVTDTGNGIPPDVLPHIFEPFFTTKEVGKGTGLGLAVIKTIVNNHNGYIDVETRPGNGASFCIGLPASKTQPSLDEKPLDMSSIRGEGSILLVDDEEDVRDVTVRILERLGYRVRIASSGLQAIDLFQKEAAELVMLDVQMPGIDGFETLRRLQRINPKIRYVLMTGHITHDQLNNLKEYRSECVLHKPFSIEQISLTVKRAMER